MVFGQTRRGRSVVVPIAVFAACTASVMTCWSYVSKSSNAFASSECRPSASRMILRSEGGFESGKINLGVEAKPAELIPQLPTPAAECNEACMKAIFECVEDGCSIEAMTKLDAKLADDEKTIVESIEQLKAKQKTEYCEENKSAISWLEGFLGRSSSLRAQLQAMRVITDTGFVQQMIRAAAVSFGGGRKDDYPKVGASPYSA